MILSGLELTSMADQGIRNMSCLESVSADVVHSFSVRHYLGAFTYWIFICNCYSGFIGCGEM